MKKAIIFTLLFCASVTAYAQQQIPKIGVIDYSRIVQQMMPNSDQLQEIKKIKQAIEDETTAIEAEIAALEKDKTKSHFNDNTEEIDEQISSLRYYLRQFVEEKNKELEEK